MKDVPKAVEAVWKIESTRLIAAIAGATYDIGIAEKLTQDALMTALELWPKQASATHSDRTIREENSACFAEEEPMESAMAKNFSRICGDAAGLDQQHDVLRRQRREVRLSPASHIFVACSAEDNDRGSLTVEQTRLLVRDWFLIDFFRHHLIVRENPR